MSWALGVVTPVFVCPIYNMCTYYIHCEQDSLENYLQLLLPMLLRLLERRDVGIEVRRLALAVVLHLTKENPYYLFDGASRYVFVCHNPLFVGS